MKQTDRASTVRPTKAADSKPGKGSGGRPRKPLEELLLQRSYRLTAQDWEKFDAVGGIIWLRALLALGGIRWLRGLVRARDRDQ